MMRCSVCEAVNREENKFCGMCGARLHGLPAYAVKSGKCTACGKMNEPDYQYCAMCGARLEYSANVARGLEDRQVQARASGLLRTGTGGAEERGTLEPLTLAEPLGTASPLRSADVSRPSSRSASRRSSGGAGMSLLGLNDDEPGTDVSYLLREERSSRHILRKLALLAVLAGVSAIAYYSWRPLYQENPGIVRQTATAMVGVIRGWLHRPQKAQSSQSVESAKIATADETRDESKQRAASQATADGASAAAATSEQKDANREQNVATSNAGAAQSAKESPRVHRVSRSRPQRAIAPEDADAGSRKPSFALTRAQQFLQGKGVRQDCEQGLVYLKAATRSNEPAAAVQMSALYSSGHCVHRDPVMAYRWLNSAHEQEPNNAWIQQNLDVLWGRMTPQERKQIIR